MSEVYIRSQDRENLYKFGGAFSRVYYQSYGFEYGNARHSVCIERDEEDYTKVIGNYESKERCIEILDEIQKVCTSYLYTAGGQSPFRGGMDVQPLAATIPRVYEMPEI